MAKLAEIRTFFRETRQTFRTTGAVLPSSRFLAYKIADRIEKMPAPRRILEAGPGTGAVTRVLIQRLGPTDRLTMVELNERFVDSLQAKLDHDPKWSPRRDQVELIHGAVENIPAERKFHAVVCGLPFNNFEPELVDQLLGKLLAHLEPGGHLSFFEYLAIRHLKAPFVSARERARLKAVAKVMHGYQNKFEVGLNRIALNVPPAVVHHLRVPG
ncbi:MAG TPA: methyltransferase domain-containing protein [Planctomycetia bacterium]|nr:methyltransferase domain-containing protein [Planctomycetia bacterium]